MEKNEVIAQLAQMFKGLDWFFEVGTDEFGRVTVYTHYQNGEVLRRIPERLDRYEVYVHFAASKTATKDQFVDHGQRPAALEPAQSAALPELAFSVMEEDKSLFYLQSQLDKLERAVGSNTLQDIFYEIHDGKNAVTNNGTRFPEVKAKLEKLYKEFGFDVIYEELDG